MASSSRRAFSSALVHRGRDPQTLRSLADLVALDAFNEGLRFFYERRGRQTSSTIHRHIRRIGSMAS